MAISRLALVTGVAVALSACAQQQQARSVQESGFLGDYSRLEEKGGDYALLQYQNPKADWKKYDKILLDPVTYYQPESGGLSPEDAQTLTNNFYTLLHQQLSKDYQMTSQPGPNTLRIQVALTDANRAFVPLRVATTVIPQAFVVSTLVGYATGKPTFTGEESVEAQVTDAKTGEVLLQAVDRRVGGKHLSADIFNSWGDVDNIMRYWAIQARYRLCVLRGAADCVPPPASV